MDCAERRGPDGARRDRAQIQAFDTQSGALRATLRGHFAAVTAVVYHPALHELYSGGHDGNLLCWTALR